MPLYDQTGRAIEVEQIAHVLLNGMYEARVVEVHETALEIPGRGTRHPQLLLQILIPVPAPAHVAEIYVVRTAPPKKAELVQ